MTKKDFKKKILIFLDEAGDHSLSQINNDFPIFALAGVIFNPEDYQISVNKINKFKLKYFSHEGIILHSREISGREGDYNFLNNTELRESFLEDLSRNIQSLELKIIASVIKKKVLVNKYKNPFNPYSLALEFVFEKVFEYACTHKVDYIHFIAESRGSKENKELHKVFKQLRGENRFCEKDIIPCFVDSGKLNSIHARLEFRKKQSNVIGHQIADLIVSPIARTILSNKEHPSLKYFKEKFIFGFSKGVKVFP